MTDASPPTGSGWTFGKVLGLIVGLLGMVGFGFCSLCGIVVGISDSKLLGAVAMFVIPGLLLTALCFWLFRTMLRAAKRRD